MLQYPGWSSRTNILYGVYRVALLSQPSVPSAQVMRHARSVANASPCSNYMCSLARTTLPCQSRQTMPSAMAYSSLKGRDIACALLILISSPPTRRIARSKTGCHHWLLQKNTISRRLRFQLEMRISRVGETRCTNQHT